MRISAIILIAISLVACSFAPQENLPTATPTPTPSVLRTPDETPLGPVKPSVKLGPAQKKLLDETVPPKVREILEKSTYFAVVGMMQPHPLMEWGMKPNRIAVIQEDDLKKEILEKFYIDASKAESPAHCFNPHHGLRAVYGNEKVDVDICYGCSRFEINYGGEQYSGTIVRDSPVSEPLLNAYLVYSSVPIPEK